MSDKNLTPLLSALFVCTAVVYFLNYLWKRRRIYYLGWKLNGPLSLPLIGNAHLLIGGTHDIFETGFEINRKYRPIMRFWMGNKLLISTSKPEFAEIILNNSLEKASLYSHVTPLLGLGLATSKVDIWKKHRKHIALTFNPKILNSFMEIFVEYSNILVEKLEDFVDSEPKDIFPIINLCTMDIVCETTMGTKVRAMSQGSGYIKWVARIAELNILRLFQLWLHPDIIWKQTSMHKELDRLTNKLWTYVQKIVETKRNEGYAQKQEYCDGITNRKIFLDHLIELTDQEGKWGEDELISETQTMVVTGSESTASSDCFVLIVLGILPEIQKKVLEELDSIFEDSSRDVTTEDLSKMVYLERVIKETLRLFPVVAMVGRMLTQDVQLGPYVIPKGVDVSIPIFYMHKDPDVWPNPLKFDPDRFLPEEVAKRHPCSFIPFSAGPRNCIGVKYAMMAMKTVLSTILRHYKVSSTSYKSLTDVKLKIDILTKVHGGYNVSLQRRTRAKMSIL